MELDRQSTLEDSVIAIVRIKASEIGLTIVTGGAPIRSGYFGRGTISGASF